MSPQSAGSSGIHIGALTNKEARINSTQVSVMSSQNQMQQWGLERGRNGGGKGRHRIY